MIHGSSALQKFQLSMDQLAKWGAVVLLLGAPTSIALVNVATLLIVIGWLFSGNFRWKWEVIRYNPITLPSLMLFGLVLIGIAYTEARPEYINRHLYVYSRLLLMLMLLTLLFESKWQRRALIAFAVGSLITLVSTYVNIWWHVPWSDSNNQGLGVTHNVFNDHIAQGLAMSFFVVLAVFYALAEKSWGVKAGWMLVILLAIFSITHLLQGRTGQVVLLVMLPAILLVAAPVRWRWHFLALLILLLVLAFASSPLLLQRFAVGLDEFNRYLDGDMSLTSIGARLDMWRISIDMFLDSPWWGHGTGSYRMQAELIYVDPVVCATSCIHPHNQFLFFGVEYGIIGILTYAWLLQRSAAHALQCEIQARILLVGFLSVMLVSSFINGPLWVTTERNFFTAVLPLLMAGWRMQSALR